MLQAIQAMTSAGHTVMVSPQSITALMPDQDDEGRTTLMVDGQLLSAEGDYEDWMRTFASFWNGTHG